MEGAADFVWNDTGLCEQALAGIRPATARCGPGCWRCSSSRTRGGRWRTRSRAPPKRSRWPNAWASAGPSSRRCGPAEDVAHSGPDGARDRLAFGDHCWSSAQTATTMPACGGNRRRFDALAQLGQVDGAEAEAGDIDAAAARLRSPLARWHALRCRGTIAAARGRFTDALACGRQAEALARRAGHDETLMPSLGFLAAVRADLGDARPADPQLPTRYRGVASVSMRAIEAWWALRFGPRRGGTDLPYAAATSRHPAVPAADDAGRDGGAGRRVRR